MQLGNERAIGFVMDDAATVTAGAASTAADTATGASAAVGTTGPAELSAGETERACTV